MSAPIRIQLSRKKGWKMPPNTVVVSRPSKWGNPYREGDEVQYGGRTLVRSREDAVRAYESHLRDPDLQKHLHELTGKNLACWCRLGEPCHADVLLRLANEEQ